MSRFEKALISCINGEGIEDLGIPQSRAEELLQLLSIKMSQVGGNSSGGSTGGNGLNLVGEYPIEYSEVDSGYKIIHPISAIPVKSLYIVLQHTEHAYPLLTTFLTYVSATVISGHGYLYGASVSIPNVGAAISILWVVDPDFANSLIDVRLSASEAGINELIPLDGYTIKIYTLD